MPLPAIGFFAWLFGLVTSSFTAFTTFLITKMVYEKAVQFAFVTAFLVAAGALTVSISLSIKATIIAAQIYLPPPMAVATYFLPSNVNQVMALIVTIRVSVSLYRWTVATLSAYVPTKFFGSKYAF